MHSVWDDSLKLIEEVLFKPCLNEVKLYLEKINIKKRAMTAYMMETIIVSQGSIII